jgi:hypothetical protein
MGSPSNSSDTSCKSYRAEKKYYIGIMTKILKNPCHQILQMYSNIRFRDANLKTLRHASLKRNTLQPNNIYPEMAHSNPLQHRRTHNILLISKILGCRENLSPFTLILDSLEQKGNGVMREMIARAVVSPF